MNTISDTTTQQQIYEIFSTYSTVVYAFIGVIALWEIIARIINKKMSLRYVIDSISSLLTLPAIGGLGYLTTLLGMGTVFGLGQLLYNENSAYSFGWSWWSFAAVMLLTDFWYYWNHRAFHRINIMWTTHTVHHSSDYINIPMSIRFGPLDGFFVNLFHLPLMLFFDPNMVMIGIIANQIYQSWIHTDRIQKMPEWFEAWFNTPSHHRVHHGSNPQYLDKNYAGILMCWDKWFGTFEPEQEEVHYGITKPLKYQDPITVMFHGFWRFGHKLATVRSMKELVFCFVMPPGWQTRLEQERDVPLEGQAMDEQPSPQLKQTQPEL